LDKLALPRARVQESAMSRGRAFRANQPDHSPHQAQPPWRYAVAGPEHDDFRADRRAVVKIDDVLVRQANAARRDVGANGPGFIGAVDAV
jgi:hypothetical protein